MRRVYECASHRDWDALIRFYGRDPDWDMSPMGLGIYEGRASMRRFWEDWAGAYEDLAVAAEEVLDLGNGVVFAVVRQDVVRLAAQATFDCTMGTWSCGRRA
jgi:hypothetical protein